MAQDEKIIEGYDELIKQHKDGMEQILKNHLVQAKKQAEKEQIESTPLRERVSTYIAKKQTDLAPLWESTSTYADEVFKKHIAMAKEQFKKAV